MAKRGVIFKEAPVIKPNRSWCDDSHKHDTSCNFGELIIGHCSDHMANDVIKLKSDSFGYVQPMLAPVFGKCDLFSYWFYVNKRHVWPDWKKFRPNNDQLLTWEQMRTFVSPTMPYITLNGLRGNSVNLPDVFIEASNYSSSHPYWLLHSDITSNFGVAIFRTSTAVDSDHIFTLYYEDVEFNLNGQPFALPSDYRYIFVIYRRNLDQIQSKYGNSWYKEDRVLNTMNIFSPGNLFNYMDLHIGDIQKDRAKYFYYAWREVLDSREDTTGVRFNLQEVYDFMCRHYTCSFFQFRNTSNGPNFFGINDSTGSWYEDDLSEIHEIQKRPNWEPFPETTIENASSLLPPIAKIFKKDYDTRINTLPIRCYEYIYDEYFRDQNWIPVNTYTDFTRNGQEDYDTAEKVRYFSIRKKCWSHDPYTSALPGPQRGDAVRFLTNANVTLGDNITTRVDKNISSGAFEVGSGNYIVGASSITETTKTGTSLVVDLSAATIENFRIANVRQRYAELFARTGGRYVEWQQGVIGANISDIEDERPIYIYGSRNPIQIATVVQTSSSNVDTDQPLGDIAGRGVYTGKGDYIEFQTPDDGYLMQIICVVPQQSYQSGINPIFTRHNWLDYPIPMFAQLGEEHVKVQNIWFDGIRDNDEKSFGYQSRYWDFKYTRDMVTGQLEDSLDFWTFAREFEDEPVNGRDFLEVNVDYRQFAVQDRGVHHITLSLYHDLNKNHALPVFGIPTL